MSTIGYLGPPGTHSEVACTTYLQRLNGETFQPETAKTFFDLFEGLNSNQFDRVIVPVENSVEGTVTLPVDLMLDHPDFHIQAEVVISVQNALIGFPDTPLSAIKRILSHDQPLAQCRHTIRKLCPDAALVPLNSTASAVQWMLNPPTKTVPDPHFSAIIGNPQLIANSPLTILVDSVNDFPNNQTRFWVLSKTPPPPQTGRDKTSLVFTLDKYRAGGLYSVLQPFAKRQINLSLLSHRPSKTLLGEYVFWMDIEGHQNEPSVAEAINEIRTQTANFRCLGSYERDPLC